MTLVRHLVLAALALAAVAAPAAAQQTPAPPPTAAPAPAQAPPPQTATPAPAPVTTTAPPGPFALDVRYAMPSYNTGSAVADPLGYRTDQLPGRGWGLDIGATAYPIRKGRFALGLGAALVRTSGKKAPDPEDETALTDPILETKFSALVPQASLNFGSARGWSYIGAGFAWSRRSTGVADTEFEDGTRLMGLHYGGGARWFLKPHLAFTFDLRFYRLPEQAEDGSIPFQPKTRLFLASAGVSFK